MKPLSRIAEQVNESSTLAMDALYKQMKADGIDVLGFAAGEPDFPTPDRIKLAAIEAIINNETKYTPATGTMALKQAICQRLKADCGVEYQPSQIIVSSGAKHCIYLVMQSLVNEGDEVIIPTPAWVSYSEMTKMAGGVPVFIPCGGGGALQAHPGTPGSGHHRQDQVHLLQQPLQPHRHGLHGGRAESAGGRVCQARPVHHRG